MRFLRIDHVGVVVDDLAAHVDQLEALGLSLGRTNENAESFALYPCGDPSVELIEVRDLLQARGVAVSWPPSPSGPARMIWTDGESSGGVQYQFLVRPEGGG